MIGTTSNEYINELVTVQTDSGLWQVFYEPCENGPISTLTGTIYLGEDLIHTFHVRGDREVVVSASNRKIRTVSGAFIPCDRQLVLFWTENPGEHFLCVSYEFSDRTSGRNKPNWLQEGF